MTLIFGEHYIESGELTPVFALMSIFFAFGIISSKWFLFEGLQVLAMRRNILGAILNGIANLYLIPRFGIEGAAYGTLMSLVFTNYIYDALSYRTRDLFYMKSKWFIFVNLKSNFNMLKKKV